LSRNIARQSFLGFGLTILILCVVMAISYHAVQSLSTAEENRAHTFNLMQALQKVELELQDADTAEREFLLTNNPKVLKPYDLSLKNHKSNFSLLADLTSGDPTLKPAIERLEKLVEAKQADMAEGIDMRGRVGFDAAVQIVLDGEGNAIMDEIRLELRKLISSEHQKLIMRDAKVNKEAHSAKMAMLAGTITAVLVAVFAGMMIRLTLREREFVAQQLRDAHQGLEQKVLERTAELNTANHQLQTEIEFRQKTENALREQRHFLNAVLQSLNEGIIAFDTRGQITVVNNVTRKFFGLPIGEIPPYGPEWSKYYDVLNADGTKPLIPEELPMQRAIAGERFLGAELIVAAHGSPNRVLWATGQPIIDEDDQRLGAVVALHDITEIKASEKARQAQESAEAANHAKSEFLSRMSHELRTPLNAILGFTQLMQMDSLTPGQKESTDQILKGGRHLLSLINEVLDISRIEAGRLELSLEPVLVVDAVNEVIDLIGPIAQTKNISLRSVNKADNEIHVMADRQKLKQVLMNLLSNAVKYNRQDGWVEIVCEEPVDKRIRLLVADSGFGIPVERFHRLFRPFDRLGAENSEIEGTGLGLCLTKGFVEVMGGTMGILSSTSKGTTFWIEFLEADAQIESVASVPMPNANPKNQDALKLGKVLYIEDNISNLKLVERIIEQRPGITLLTSVEGQLGIELARSHSPDLIFLDLNLSDMHGSQVLHQLKSSAVTSNIPVVAVSADATSGQILRIMSAGAANYLTKPINISHFLEEIDKVFSQAESV